MTRFLAALVRALFPSVSDEDRARLFAAMVNPVSPAPGPGAETGPGAGHQEPFRYDPNRIGGPR